MSNNKYFLMQAVAMVPCRFDSVDKTVYDNWNKIVDGEGEKLYCGIGFEWTPNGPKIKGDPTWAQFGVMVRLMGVNVPANAVPGGYLREPEFVRMKTKSGNYRPYEIKRDSTED